MLDNAQSVRILFLGDIVGGSGITQVLQTLPRLREQHQPHAIIVNGENSAPDGRGITPEGADQLFEAGIDVITTGNHVWGKREIIPYITTHKRLLRPANYPGGSPGVGTAIITTPNEHSIGVLNLMGRVFMHEQLDCPFRAAQSALTYLKAHAQMIFIDMHAETTAEKIALASMLDGTVTALVGTHTHVQTADERILPRGTAFMTDVGMCGALYSSLGMRVEPVIQRFLTQMPQRFSVATEGPKIVSGVLITAQPLQGIATSILRIQMKIPA